MERGARGIMLTPAGTLLAERSGQVMRDLESARQTINDLKNLETGHVSIHVNGAVINAILAPALARFYALHPTISISVSVTSAQDAIAAVTARRTDIAVTMFSPADSATELMFKTPVLHEPVMAPTHPLAADDVISLAAIRAHALAIPDHDFSVRRDFDARQREAGLVPVDATFTTSSVELQKELAREGAAVLILPAMTVARELRDGTLTIRPLEKRAEIRTEMQLVRARDLTPTFAARRFAAFLEDFLKEHDACK